MGFGNELKKSAGKAVAAKVFGTADSREMKSRMKRDQAKAEAEKEQARLEHEQSIEQIEIEHQQAQQTLELEHKLEKERLNQKQFDEVFNVEFDTNDVNNLIKSLTALSSLIDLWKNDIGLTMQTNALRSKFDTGLAFLNSKDINNPMCIHFNKLKEKWSTEQNEKLAIEQSKAREQSNKKNLKKDIIISILFWPYAIILLIKMLNKK